MGTILLYSGNFLHLKAMSVSYWKSRFCGYKKDSSSNMKKSQSIFTCLCAILALILMYSYRNSYSSSWHRVVIPLLIISVYYLSGHINKECRFIPRLIWVFWIIFFSFVAVKAPPIKTPGYVVYCAVTVSAMNIVWLFYDVVLMIRKGG